MLYVLWVCTRNCWDFPSYSGSESTHTHHTYIHTYTHTHSETWVGVAHPEEMPVVPPRCNPLVSKFTQQISARWAYPPLIPSSSKWKHLPLILQVKTPRLREVQNRPQMTQLPGDGAGHWKHKAMIRSLKLSAPGSPSLQSEEGLEVCCFFNWSITDLQCCVYFSCTAKWFSYTYIHSFFVSFSIMVYHGILTIAPCSTADLVAYPFSV